MQTLQSFFESRRLIYQLFLCCKKRMKHKMLFECRTQLKFKRQLIHHIFRVSACAKPTQYRF